MVVADWTGSCGLVLRKDDMSSLEERKSYCLVDMGGIGMVSLFHCEKL